MTPVSSLARLALGAAALFASLPSSGRARDAETGAAAAPARSLLANPDFSQPDARGDWPAGWGGYAPGNGMTWETEAGNRFLRLVSTKPGQLQLLGRTLTLPRDVSAVTVAVRYRVASGMRPPGAARVLFFFRDAPGRLLRVAPPPLDLDAPPGRWADASRRLTLPVGATRLTLLAGLPRDAAGAVDLAGLRVTADPSVATRVPEPPEAAGPSLLPAPGAPLPSGQSLREEDGRRFLRLVSESPGQMQMLTRVLPIAPGLHGVEITARFRTVGVHFGEHEWFDTRTIVQFLDADDHPVRLPHGSLDLVFGHKPAPTGWREIVRTCRVPAGAVRLRLMAGLFQAASGTVDLSELRVTPVDDATLDRHDLLDAVARRRKAEEDAGHERRVDKELAARLAATGNLIPNGGFETAGASAAWPAGWGGKKPGDTLSWLEEAGDHFVRLAADPGKTVMLYHMQPLPSGTHAVEICVRYRVTGVKPGGEPFGDARAILHFLGGLRFGHLEYGRQYDPAPAPLLFDSAPGAWHEVHRRCAVPAGATKLQLMPGLWNTAAGTLDLSAIRVSPVAPAPRHVR